MGERACCDTLAVAMLQRAASGFVHACLPAPVAAMCSSMRARAHMMRHVLRFSGCATIASSAASVANLIHHGIDAVAVFHLKRVRRICGFHTLAVEQKAHVFAVDVFFRAVRIEDLRGRSRQCASAPAGCMSIMQLRMPAARTLSNLVARRSLKMTSAYHAPSATRSASVMSGNNE
jgi:hypothetical protein